MWPMAHGAGELGEDVVGEDFRDQPMPLMLANWWPSAVAMPADSWAAVLQGIEAEIGQTWPHRGDRESP